MTEIQQAVPALRFSKFREEWEIKRLRDVAKFQNGKAHEQNISSDGYIIVVNSKFISTEGRVKKFVDAQISPLFTNDIVMVMSDVPRGKALAKCYMIERDDLYSLNQRICSLQAKNVDPYYLFLVTNRNDYFLKFDSGFSQTNLRKDEVLRCPMYYPTLVEQQKIASFLSSVDTKIEQLGKKYSLLEKYKKGMMQKLFAQEICFKDEQGNGFSDWEEKRLGDVAEIYDGTHQTPKYVKAGIPFYSVEHVTADQFTSTKYISEEVFKKEGKRVTMERGDILMTRIGSIGVAKYINWNVRASFYVSLALLKPSKVLIGKFLAQYIMDVFFQRELWKRTIHVAFPIKINLGEITNCLVRIPQKEEQQKIADFLSAIDQKIELVGTELELAQAFKKGLLQQMFI